jgi:hypothetical protein
MKQRYLRWDKSFWPHPEVSNPDVCIILIALVDISNQQIRPFQA